VATVSISKYTLDVSPTRTTADHVKIPVGPYRTGRIQVVAKHGVSGSWELTIRAAIDPEYPIDYGTPLKASAAGIYPGLDDEPLSLDGIAYVVVAVTTDGVSGELDVLFCGKDGE
jgi:hypothetical protein